MEKGECRKFVACKTVVNSPLRMLVCAVVMNSCKQGIEFQNEPIPVPTPLCKSHYHAVYDALQTRHKNCRTCGKRLRMGMDRPCPQPHTIQKYLYDTLHLTWDTEQNMQNVRERVGILLKGCKCMTGCKNRVC